MKHLCLFIIFLLLINCGGTHPDNNSKKIALFSIDAGSRERNESIISLSLDDVTLLPATELCLYEITDNKRVEVNFQVSSVDRRTIHWVMTGITPSGKIRKYELCKGKANPVKPEITIKKETTGYTIFAREKPVLTYNSSTVYPPEGVEEAYKRSGFIHPLYAPDRSVLTTIQPEDHYHHYGIWNPWTKTRFKNEEVDFWNLLKLEGTVQHAGMISIHEGAVFGSLGFLHEHIAWPGSDKETKAITEYQEIKVYSRNDGVFMIDIVSSLSPLEPITLEEYRYGGFGFRATKYWTKDNTEIFTSEGKSRNEADGKRAFWCVVNGKTENGSAGILLMGHPSNFNHPEPLRVWPDNMEKDKGYVFINFSPTRNTDWLLEPGNTYMLRYRLVVYEGKCNASCADSYWNEYASPPVIRWER